MDVKELRRQHEDIMAVANKLSIAVQDHSAQQPVAALRWQLARMLIAHLAVEDGYFYPAMLDSADDATRRTATCFQSEMGELAAEFTRYMRAWTDMQIAAQWPLFCKETRAVLTTLEKRVIQEDEHLYPLAAEGWSTSALA